MFKKERIYRKKIQAPCPVCGTPIRGTSKKHWVANCTQHLNYSLKHGHRMNLDEARKIAESALKHI